MMDWFSVALVIGAVSSLAGVWHLTLYRVVALVILALIRFVLIPLDCDLTLKFYELFGKKPESLKGKVIWITGASKGIGACMALRLAKAGARLALSARSVEKLEEVKQQCVETGGVKEDDVLVLPLDVLQYDKHQTTFDTLLKHFGQLDILVNNAGRSQRGCWEDIQVNVDRAVFELDVFSTMSLSRIALKYFLGRGRGGAGGHLAVTSSTAGKTGVPMSASYTGAKHALHGYFESLRTEKIGQGLHVTMACPGPVVSSIDEDLFTDQEGQCLERKRTGAMMTGERCADLFCIALANHLQEVWMAPLPVLLIMYCVQYLPSTTKSIMERIPLELLLKLREGKIN